MARFVTDKGFTSRFEYTLQTLKEVPYNKWRVYEPENTMRFFALRLHEAGMIKSTPRRSSPRAPTGGSSMSSSGS